MDEKNCMNCRYLLYLIAIGQGLRCSNENNKENDNFKVIPSKNYCCEYFESKKIHTILHDVVKGYITREFEHAVPDVWSLTFNDQKKFKNYPPSIIKDLNKKVIELINSNLFNDDILKLLTQYHTELEKYIN